VTPATDVHGDPLVGCFGNLNMNKRIPQLLEAFVTLRRRRPGARLLLDAWAMREQASFSLPPSLLALDPTDEVQLSAGGRVRRLRLTTIEDADARQVAAVATDRAKGSAGGILGATNRCGPLG